MELVEFADLNVGWERGEATRIYKQLDDGASRHRTGKDKRGWKEGACGVSSTRLLDSQGETPNGAGFTCLEFKRESLSWRCELWSPQYIDESLEIRHIYTEDTRRLNTEI